MESTAAPPGHSRYTDRMIEHADRMPTGIAGRWRQWFAGRVPNFDGRVFCEVGCADAALLAEVAAANPTVGFVGIDWKYKSIFEAATRCARHGLGNVGLIRGKGQELPILFENDELDGLWIFHPDPCDAPVDRPARLIDDRFLTAVHPLLRPGASLAIKTDHPGYYQVLRRLIGRPDPGWLTDDPGRVGPSPRFRRTDVVREGDLPPAGTTVIDRYDVAVDSPDFWLDPGVRRPTKSHLFAGRTSPFEQRYRRKRLPIYYVELVAKRADAASTLPVPVAASA